MANFAANPKVSLLAPTFQQINIDLYALLSSLEAQWAQEISEVELNYILRTLSIFLSQNISVSVRLKFLDAISHTESFDDFKRVYESLPTDTVQEVSKVQAKIDAAMFEALQKSTPLRLALTLPTQVSTSFASILDIHPKILSNTQKFAISIGVLLGATFLVTRIAR